VKEESMTHIVDEINPWACMPPLAMIESLKFVSDDQSPVATNATTVNGFQPLLGNLLMLDEPFVEHLRSEVLKVLSRHGIDGEIERSWAVSYNFQGKQTPHRHREDGDERYSGVVCLNGSDEGGELCFDGATYKMHQGDIVLFKSREFHWTNPTQYPKVVVAFDMK
jgi:hypothetical protein